jgi:hypothetical protein
VAVMKSCPCGCGRSANWTDRRLARRALFIHSLCDGLTRCRDVAATSDSECVRSTVEPIEQMVQEGAYFDRTLLLLAHGAKVAPFGIALFDDDGRTIEMEATSERRELDDREANALKVIKAGRRTDPGSFPSWRPYGRSD